MPFQDAGAEGPSDAVAWLRIVYGPENRCLLAGLFETTARGEPLGFGFAAMALPAGSGATRQDTAARLADDLFRMSDAPPALLIGFGEEIPSAVTGGLGARAPFCRVGRPSQWDAAAAGIAAGDSPDRSRRQVSWAAEPPAPESAAGRVFGEIVTRADPYEPLERAGRALAEALAEPHVEALTGFAGVRTLIALPLSTGAAGEEERRDAARDATARGPHSEDRRDPGFAERIWAVLAAPSGASGPLPSVPPDIRLEWPGDLMPFQREGVQVLIDMDRLLLSDDMGLGKTVQAIAALRILRARGELGPCLVVAPSSVLDQWRRELAKWAPELTAIVIRGSANDRVWQWKAATDVTIVSYDVLRSDAGILPNLRTAGTVWGAIVLDEAQKIKNRNDTSEAVKSIPRTRSWALTGTPLENDEEELASIMEFVDYNGRSPRKRYRPGAELQLRHRELQLRRRKADVLQDLPPKLETRLTIPLRPDQRRSYDRAEREGIVYLKALGADVGIQHVLELITRLKQICNVDPKTGASSKLDDISERLSTLTAQGHKALIFSQYTSENYGVAGAARRLKAFDPLTLTGDMPVEQRMDIVDRFKTGDAHKALIVSLRAGGVGLNLQEASYVFHLDRWWNPAVERQAEDRSHRMGQTVRVNAIKYACMETIEERIDGILERKQALFDRLVDDVSLDLSARMTRSEMLGLFGLN